MTGTNAHPTAHDLIRHASAELTPGLEHIRYNADRGCSLQPDVLMAPIRESDSDERIRQKLRLGAIYLDILLARKEWNGSPTDQATMQAHIDHATKRIRDTTEPHALATELHALLEEEPDRIADDNAFGLDTTSERVIHRVLARFTEFVEQGSGGQLDYDTLVATSIENPYRVATILDSHAADDHPDRHRLLGNRILLTSSFVQKHGDAPYGKRVKLYMMENLLAASLEHNAYLRRPGFVAFIDRTGLPFRMHDHFGPDDILKRQRLYTAIANHIWNPHRLLDEVNG